MTKFIQNLLESRAGAAAFILRVPIGIILAAHGGQKLFGWFGGYGLTPGYLMASLAGSAEFFGGLALIIGLLSRPAAAVSAFTMLVALVSVHWGQGFFLSTNGIEYALALAAATLALAVQGGGALSVDQLIVNFLERSD